MESEFQDMVQRLKKPGETIAAELTGNQASALHMAIGVAGEAGELLDAIKKWTVYRKDLDRENVVEELGDIDFYLEGLRQDLGISREEKLAYNIEKLDKKRYKEGYSDQAAQARADKELKPVD